MKKLLAGLMMLPCVALADAWSIKNNNGGEIVITDRACIYNGKNYENLREAYTYGNLSTIRGCWKIEDGMAVVIWHEGSGDVMHYPLADFTQKSVDRKKR